LLVYWYLLRSQSLSVGPRKVARSLGFSSPSVALYHLEKLRSLGLVEKSETGEYKLVQEVKVGVLRYFIKLRRLWVPRYLFYSVWFSVMFIIYLIFFGQSGCVHNIVAILFGSIACVILWYETIKLWREKPF